MLVKALVLDGEEGLGYVLGQGVQADGPGIERATHGQHFAIHVLQGDRRFASGDP